MTQVIVSMQQEGTSSGSKFSGTIQLQEKKVTFYLTSMVYAGYILLRPHIVNAQEDINRVADKFKLSTSPGLLEIDTAGALKMVLVPIMLAFYNHPRTMLYNQSLEAALKEVEKPPVQLFGCPLIQHAMMLSTLEVVIGTELSDELVACLF